MRRLLSGCEVGITRDNGAIRVIYGSGERGRHWAGECPRPGDAASHAHPPPAVLDEKRGGGPRAPRVDRGGPARPRPYPERPPVRPTPVPRGPALGLCPAVSHPD